MNNQKGQSLVEILIGLGVISIMITASSYALVSVLRNSTVNEQNQSAGLIGNSLLESAAVLAEANWNGIYNLSKGSANHYFLINSPTTTPLAVVGDESVLSENIINGLVGHWKFDEISTNTTRAYDSSGTGNLGALTNSPTRTASASCKVGACLSFDGLDDHIQTSGANLSSGSGFTYSMWIKPNFSTYQQPLIHWGTTSVVRLYWRFESASRLYIDESAVAPTNVKMYWNGALFCSSYDCNGNVPAYSNGNWYFVVVTGNLTGDSMSNVPILIGSGNPTHAGRYFNGSIDDVRIYNRVLSATEISQLYNSPAYSRYFYVDNVKRTLCGTGVITTDAESTCLGASGVSEDPSTQTITANTSWNLKGVSGSLENSIYMTRWVNSVSKQTDWGGSSGTAGAVSEFGTNYFDYSGISTTTSGAIKVSGI
ncbi:MAG: LamG-like jellyroll fold domain-containing protein [Patescibacteria group bacterium]